MATENSDNTDRAWLDERDSPQQAERDALTALLQSEGWRVFAAHAQQECGAARILQLIDSQLAMPDGSVDLIRQIRAASLQVEQLLRWPQERISVLKRDEVTRGIARASAGLLAGRRI